MKATSRVTKLTADERSVAMMLFATLTFVLPMIGLLWSVRTIRDRQAMPQRVEENGNGRHLQSRRRQDHRRLLSRSGPPYFGNR